MLAFNKSKVKIYKLTKKKRSCVQIYIYARDCVPLINNDVYDMKDACIEN